MEKIIPESEWRHAYRDILDFERTISDDGYLIIKFFLHISKAEQKQRFEALVRDPLTAWQVVAEDWDHHRHYEQWRQAYEEMFENTESEWAPWTIVEATDRRYTQMKIYQTVVKALEARLGPNAPPIEATPVAMNLEQPQPSGEEREIQPEPPLPGAIVEEG